MCGRGRCKIGKESLAAATGVPAADFHDMAQFAGAENMSPGSCFPIKSKNEEGDTQLRAMVWGLIPSFSISVASPNHFKMFNARSETVYEKKSFSALIQSRRGVVFMNGYYEWKIEAGIKQPYYVHRSSGELLKMACVFDTYRRRDDLSVLYTFSILTTEANKTISWLHERQPLFIVDKDTEATWCAQDTPRSGVVSVLASRDVPHDITAHPVTRKVSSALYQEDDCCIAIPRQRKANSYFSRADDSNTVKKEISADVAVADTPKRSHSDTPPTANNTIISYFRQSTTPIIKRAKLSHTSSPEAVAIVRTSEKSTTERDAAALQASSAHMSTSSVSDHDTIAANNVVVIEITSDDDGEDISTASKLKPTTAAATIS